jgi:CcmD family protein
MDKNTSYQLSAISYQLKRKGQKAIFLKRVFCKVVFFMLALLSTVLAKAQDTPSKKELVDMATGMRSNGKIYVVVAVLCIILAGVFIYLINLDKKISKLEKEMN